MKVIEELVKKYLLKPISILPVFLLLCGMVVVYIPDDATGNRKFAAVCCLCGVAFLVYLGFVWRYNRLPHSKTTGVLFVFHTANEDMYKDARFLFTESFSAVSKNFDIRLTPVCISADRVKGYDISNKGLMGKLLGLTNCAFCIDICYKTDDPRAAQNYEVVICTDVLHPNLSDATERFLINELHRVSKPVNTLSFKKDEKLERITVASSQLHLISKYILSLLYLILEDYDRSNAILKDLYENGKATDSWLYGSVKKAYYLSCREAESVCQTKYNDLGNPAYLDQAEAYLKQMDLLFPNTYDYDLDMARVLFIKYRKIAEAKQLINQCKKSGFFDTWMYSEAFLYAYDNGDVNVIIQKYQRALLSDYNVVDIIKFIETVAQEEPQKTILHLPLALLYHSLDDKKLTALHLNRFLDGMTQPLSNKARRTIKELQSGCCDRCAQHRCETCQQIA